MMRLTLTEVKERLKQIEETELLDLLGVTSEELVERFDDIVEEKLDKCRKAVDWD